MLGQVGKDERRQAAPGQTYSTKVPLKEREQNANITFNFCYILFGGVLGQGKILWDCSHVPIIVKLCNKPGECHYSHILCHLNYLCFVFTYYQKKNKIGTLLYLALGTFYRHLKYSLFYEY